MELVARHAVEGFLPGRYPSHTRTAFGVLPRRADAPERVELAFAVNLVGEQGDFEMMDETEIRNVLAHASEPVYLRSCPGTPILSEQLTDLQRHAGPSLQSGSSSVRVPPPAQPAAHRSRRNDARARRDRRS